MTVGLMVFACVFGGTLFGMYLSKRVATHHLSADSRDVMKMALGIIGTLAALVLGLLLASAKSSPDAQSNGINQISADLLLLIVLVGWFTIIFTCLGLFAPRNALVMAIMLACALSVSAAIVLILELDSPYQGVIRLSNAPLRNALAHMGQ